MSLRQVLFWTLSGAFTLAVAPVVGEYFVELARERELYSSPTDKLEALLNWAGGLFGDWTLYVACGLGGAIVGFVADGWLRQREQTAIATESQTTKALPDHQSPPEPEWIPLDDAVSDFSPRIRNTVLDWASQAASEANREEYRSQLANYLLWDGRLKFRGKHKLSDAIEEFSGDQLDEYVAEHDCSTVHIPGNKFSIYSEFEVHKPTYEENIEAIAAEQKRIEME